MAPQDEDLIIVETSEQGCVVRIRQDAILDPRDVEQVSRQLRSTLGAAEPPNLILVLDNVSQLSSLMLSVLIALRTQAKARGGQVCLAAISERVDHLLEIMRLRDVFPTYDTADEARASLQS